MQIVVNGQAQEVPDGSDVHALLRQCNLTPEKVAVELNRRLLRSDKYASPLHEGDQVEIVTFVGGGA
jgi:thiamine biosynthesis protein ThiS